MKMKPERNELASLFYRLTGNRSFALSSVFSEPERSFLKDSLLLLFIITISGCGEWTRLSLENRSSALGKDAVLNGPELTAVHLSGDSSRVYFRFPPGSLLMKKSGEVFTSSLFIRYAFFNSYEEKVPVDTGSFGYTLGTGADNVSVTDSFDLFTGSARHRILRLSFVDLNKNTTLVRYLTIIRKKTPGPQDVLIRMADGKPAYSNCFPVSASVSISGSTVFPDTLWLRCYFRNFPLATLPFRLIADPVFNMAADSVVRISSDALRNLMLTREGIYFFQSDTSLSAGFSLLCFGDGFPEVRKAYDLIEATRYITTRSEYQKLMASTQPKADLDRFWLDIGGNTERGRLLIRNYYGRMQQANQLFTSYMDGWKTDRGMIYMIFGLPGTVYTDGETEHWTYTRIPGLPELLFVFRKINNPFTENDYALIRQQAYENPWYIAVDRWRQGRVVNDE